MLYKSNGYFYTDHLCPILYETMGSHIRFQELCRFAFSYEIGIFLFTLFQLLSCEVAECIFSFSSMPAHCVRLSNAFRVGRWRDSEWHYRADSDPRSRVCDAPDCPWRRTQTGVDDSTVA